VSGLDLVIYSQSLPGFIIERGEIVAESKLDEKRANALD